jgi:hypothetical protein
LEQTSNLPYDYTLDDVHTVKDTVKKYAGIIKDVVSSSDPCRSIPRLNSQNNTNKKVIVQANGLPMFIGKQFDLSGKLLNSERVSHRYNCTRKIVLRTRPEKQ